MSKKPSDHPVRITAEERLHPALRTLGRACIALARWQREQASTPTTAATTPPDDTEPTPPARSAEAEDQEAHDG